MKYNQNDVYLYHLNIFNCLQYIEHENNKLSSTAKD